nr:MAG TPA: terminase small subunit [Caudoviricetes sp.]
MAKKKEIDLGRVEDLAAQGLTHAQIADALGIGETSFYARKKESEDFEAAIKRGRAKGIEVVTNKLFEQCREGNTTAIIFFLKARAGWSDKVVVDNISSDGSMTPPRELRMSKEDFHGALSEALKEITG